MSEAHVLWSAIREKIAEVTVDADALIDGCPLCSTPEEDMAAIIEPLIAHYLRERAVLAMKTSHVTYTKSMDMLVLTTVGILLAEPTSTRQVATTLGLLRKLVQSCLELAMEEEEE